MVKNPPANARDVTGRGIDPWVGEGMASHSSVLAWRIQRTEEPGRLQSIGLQRTGLGLALGSPIFPSGCEGKLGVALESLQGLRDLT